MHHPGILTQERRKGGGKALLVRKAGGSNSQKSSGNDIKGETGTDFPEKKAVRMRTRWF